LATGYLYYEVITGQISKKAEQPCGDVAWTERDKSATIHILCDGVGSGIKANIAATMCVARMKELLKNGFSLREAFASIVRTMEEARKKDLPCVFFTVTRVLSDGVAVILNYEMPEILFVSKKYSTHLNSIVQPFYEGIVSETNCMLYKGDGLILMSDGITQAGMGKGLPNGWTIEGVNKFVNDQLRSGVELKNLPISIINEAKKKWHNQCEDDLSVSLIYCRKGIIINIFTGPPINSETDDDVVNEFLSNDGLKIVCGATTAKIVARYLGKELEIDQSFNSMISPPNYEIEGIDLVTEGAVTLNQLYNIWGEELEKLEKDNPVTILYALLSVADKVNMFVGKSHNPAGDDISFKQNGILRRDKIVPLLIHKFQQYNKIVTVQEY
jgi:hypothetical protein